MVKNALKYIQVYKTSQEKKGDAMMILNKLFG